AARCMPAWLSLRALMSRLAARCMPAWLSPRALMPRLAVRCCVPAWLLLSALLPRPAAAPRFAPGLLLLTEGAPGVFGAALRLPVEGRAGERSSPSASPSEADGGAGEGGASSASSSGAGARGELLAAPQPPAVPSRVDCGAAGLVGRVGLAGHGPGEVV